MEPYGVTGLDDGSIVADSVLREIARAAPTAPPVVLRRGARVGHYEVEALLGRGGMGAVYRAVDTRLGRNVALKILRASLGDKARSYLLREARSAAAAHHPHVAAVYDVGEADHLVYIAMELVDGTNLRARLAAGPLGADEARRLAREIAQGLAAAHARGVVHRDLKPENLMIAPDGTAKIVDFGLAKLRAPTAGAEAHTLEGAVMGTPGHMAPEQAAGAATDARTDVYALGLVMHEMFTGARPGAPAGGPAIADAQLAAIVHRCVAPAPADRWADAGEVVRALDGAARAAPGRTPRPRLPAVATLAAITVLAIAVLGHSSDRSAAAAAAMSWPIAAAGPVTPATSPGGDRPRRARTSSCGYAGTTRGTAMRSRP